MRLIDADALLEELKKTDRYFMVKADIDNAPTVEPICPYLSDDEVKQPCLDGPCKRPQGDLISREALKEELELSKYIVPTDLNRLLNSEINRCIEAVDNAPTVNLSLNLDNVTEADIEKFKAIWQRANSKGLLVINNERPQDKWGKWVISEIRCPNCLEYFDTGCYSKGELNKCPSCGAKLKGGAES